MRTINFSGEYNPEFGQNVRSMFMIASADNLSSFVGKEALRNTMGGTKPDLSKNEDIFVNQSYITRYEMHETSQP